MPPTNQLIDTDVAFSQAIRDATWPSHERAEHSSFMADLFAGTAERSRFAHFTGQLYFIYDALERAAAEMEGRPLVAPFVDHRLDRMTALEQDLTALLGAGWRDAIEATAGTRDYCSRIEEVCFDWAGGFVAHHYVRYMGDLSGGVAIRKAAERAYGLGRGSGTSFYYFDAITDASEFKAGYRSLLDETEWSADERKQIIAEVLLGYRLNSRILDEI